MPDPIKIDASPTKVFFVKMLVKDIGLSRAIIDLIDNSMDGLLRLLSKQEATLDIKNHFVRLQLTKEYFEIEDNCGGIPLDIAREYAFRFGRTKETPPTEKSIGQFGVGMKRAIFKLGRKITIATVSENDRFTLTINLDTWASNDKNWDFVVKDYERFDKPSRVDQRGTKIRVDNLDESVSVQFEDTYFVNMLRYEVAHAHRTTLNKGLLLQINGYPVEYQATKLIQSPLVHPSFRQIVRHDESDNIHINLYAGIGHASSTEAGWYIFCNGRQVLGPDQSLLTGWGEDDGKSIPRFHPQFNRFRGYAFFESANTRLLPWNTTKTGVDAESELYRAIRLEMIDLTRPVIDFLNDLDREKDLPSSAVHLLHEVVTQGEASFYSELSPNLPERKFHVDKKIELAPKVETTAIRYLVLSNQFDVVRRTLGVRTAKDVGERTFKYFVKSEGLEVDEG